MMKTAIVVLGLATAAAAVAATDPPRAEISNGQVKVTLYLPDARTGFYRGTRFDWSGVLASLQYKGHEYYGQWFDGTDASVRDFVYQDQRIIAGPCTAITGPAEEFQLPLGYDQAKPGDTFVKIGVGLLRRPDDSAYSAFRLYELVDPGKWTVRTGPDSVEFTQELSVPGSSLSYAYRKTVRLVPGKPQMVLEHSLRNLGKLPIRSNVYGHNFLALDSRPPGPDFVITFPFEIKSTRPPSADSAQISGRRFLYLKPLKDQDRVSASIEGFGAEPGDHEFQIENKRAGAGMRVAGNKPLARVALWSIRTVLAVEPFIDISVDPNGHFDWTVTYDYYTLEP